LRAAPRIARALALLPTLVACHTVPLSDLSPPLAAEMAAIAQLCGSANECAAPKGTVCDAMFRTAHACFEASQGRTDCSAFEASLEHDLLQRGVGAAVQLRVAKLCEATCEAHGQGTPWDDVSHALELTICGPM
jgi:hypothetical protein